MSVDFNQEDSCFAPREEFSTQDIPRTSLRCPSWAVRTSESRYVIHSITTSHGASNGP